MKAFLEKVSIQGKSPRIIWWLSCAILCFGVAIAYYLYVESLSFWKRSPDLWATIISLLIGLMSFTFFIISSIRRANEIGFRPKLLLSAAFLPIAPFWIFVLGCMPPKSEAYPDPFGNLVKRIKVIAISSSILIVLFFAIWVSGEKKALQPAAAPGQMETGTSNSNHLPSYSECVAKGVSYYKEIGSYPFLSTGEGAQEKVIENCTRSRHAFGG